MVPVVGVPAGADCLGGFRYYVTVAGRREE
jgi:hypothetical protein